MAGALVALCSASVCAIDTEGYLRIGSADAGEPHRTCYDLPISGGHYRLGNECDLYGEFGLAHAVSADGTTYRGLAMVNFQRQTSGGGNTTADVVQLYGQAQGLALGQGSHAWIGKRYYGRAGVHILDTWFVRLDGIGFGLDHVALGGAKLGVAFFGVDARSGTQTAEAASGRPGLRFNVDLTEIAINDGGTLRLTTALTQGHADNVTGARGPRGVGASVQHDQRIDAIGASNLAWLQVARGSAGLDGNFEPKATSAQVWRWRVVDCITWQSGAIGGQAVALIGAHGEDSVNAVAQYRELSLGGRASYALASHVKLVAEAGYMEKRPDAAAVQRLAKMTFAPTWSIGPQFFDRPELRLYVTVARWNDAANAAAGPAGLTGLADDRTRGTSWGIQLETWF